MKMFTEKKGIHKVCNAWVPISITAKCTGVVAQDNINPSSCNVKIQVLKQGFCKPPHIHTCMPFGNCDKSLFLWLFCLLGTSCVLWLIVCSSVCRPRCVESRILSDLAQCHVVLGIKLRACCFLS